MWIVKAANVQVHRCVCILDWKWQSHSCVYLCCDSMAKTMVKADDKVKYEIPTLESLMARISKMFSSWHQASSGCWVQFSMGQDHILDCSLNKSMTRLGAIPISSKSAFRAQLLPNLKVSCNTPWICTYQIGRWPCPPTSSMLLRNMETRKTNGLVWSVLLSVHESLFLNNSCLCSLLQFCDAFLVLLAVMCFFFHSSVFSASLTSCSLPLHVNIQFFVHGWPCIFHSFFSVLLCCCQQAFHCLFGMQTCFSRSPEAAKS